MTQYYVDNLTGSDSNPGTSPGSGGARATVQAGLNLAISPGDVVNVKASGTYTITSAITCNNSGSATGGPITLRGYGTSPGDGVHPTITTSTNGVNLINLNGKGDLRFESLSLSSTAGSPGDGVHANTATATGITLHDLSISGCNAGIQGDLNVDWDIKGLLVERCAITGNASHGVTCSNGGSVRGSVVAGNGGDGVQYKGSGTPYNVSMNLSRCRITGNTGNGIQQVNDATAPLRVGNCTIAGNTAEGIKLNNATAEVALEIVNTAFWSNGGTYDVDCPESPAVGTSDNNAYASGKFHNVAAGPGDVTLSSNPFNSDYTINTGTAAGLSLKAAGYPANVDIGCYQHADAGGGGGAYTAASNVRSGTDRGDGVMGTLVVPSAGTVTVGTTFDNGTVGTVTLPSVGDVESGVTFGAALGSTGTFAVPAVTSVKSGVAYGASGTEFTGTFSTSGLTLSDVQGELDARNLTAAFTSGESGLVRANATQFLGQPVVLDVNHYPSVNLMDINGAAASGGDSFDANIVSVNGNAFAGANVPALLSSYAPGQDPATLVLDAAVSVHNAAGTVGAMVNTAAAPADPWARALPGTYPVGTAGAILGANLDARVSSRSTFAGGIVAGVTTPVTVTTINGQGPPANWSRLAIDSSSGGVTIRTNNDKTNYTLAAAGMDSIVVETGVNARQALSPILAASAGVVLGAGTPTVVIKGGNVPTTRITASVDNAGNRTAVNLSLPA